MSSALNKKHGPFTAKVWLLLALALVAAYLLLRHSSAASAAPNPGGDSGASQVPSPQSADQSASGSPSDAATADLLAALGSDNQQLLQGLLSQSQLFYGGGASYVPGSTTSSLDQGSTQSIAALTGLSGNPTFGVSPPSTFESGFSGSGSTYTTSPSGQTSTFEGSLPSPTLTPSTGTAPGRSVGNVAS